jgi:hypothetical protein
MALPSALPAPPATSPQVARPTAKGLEMRITGCGAADVAVGRLEVQAGLLRLVKTTPGKTKDVGIPRRIKVAVLPANSTEPLGACTSRLAGATQAGASRSFRFPNCATCGRCLEKMAFKCGATYQLRVQALGRNNKKLLASEWSQDLAWKADCQGNADTKRYS